MKLNLLVKTNSKICSVKKIDINHYEVRVKEPAKEGKANIAVINQMAKHLKIAKSRIILISGAKSKQKSIQIE